MRQPILVINAGSSSIKFSVFEAGDDGPKAHAHGEVSGIGTHPWFEVVDSYGKKVAADTPSGSDHRSAIAAICRWFSESADSKAGFAAVGHRVVHGGAEFTEPVVIDTGVIARLEALTPLAPLHQPPAIAAIRAMTSAAPTAVQIACFDTAFHHSQPPIAQQFALPRELSAKGIRRYGFHGLSYEYVVSTLPMLAPELVHKRIVVAHLGNGASLCAIDAGRSIATTMGLTPLDGLVMGTRSGLLDPGVILYLLQHEKMEAAAVEHLLWERSGLLGVSGLSSDMRELLASGEAAAAQAVDLFVYRIGRELGSLAAALGGIDGLVFTGGIGEHAAEIRRRVCRDAAWLGVDLDGAANESGKPRISVPRSRTSAWVIPTDENLIVARHTRRLLDTHDPG